MSLSLAPIRRAPVSPAAWGVLPGAEAVRHRQNPAEPTALRHPAAWGRPRGGSGGWGGGGTLPGPILGTQPAICRNPVSLLTREPPNTPQFLQIEAQRLLGPLRGTFLSVIVRDWLDGEPNASDILRLCTASTGGCTAYWDQKLGGWRCAHIINPAPPPRGTLWQPCRILYKFRTILHTLRGTSMALAAPCRGCGAAPPPGAHLTGPAGRQIFCPRAPQGL